MRKRFCLIALAIFLPSWCAAATYSEQIQAAADLGQTTYIMFHRSNDAATQRMARTIQSVVNQRSDQATWVKVNVKDRTGAHLVKQFDATRIPLPAVFGLAPNGAVTGVYRLKVGRQQLENAILTPKNAEMIKALQDQKIVVVCFQPAGGAFIPSGVEQFENDPDFRGLIYRVNASADEPGEANFFKRLKINPGIKAPVVLLYAPPGTHLGTYDAQVSGETLAERVHSSGQCNCDKCKQRRK